MRVFLTAAALLAAIALAPNAAAKEGPVARILTPLSRDAEPGSRVTVAWTVTVVEAGRRRPFGGGYVFVRLVAPTGSRTPLVYGIEWRQRGRYRATIRVPRGGVRRVEIGVMRAACSPDGTCRPAPRLFPIVGRVFR